MNTYILVSFWLSVVGFVIRGIVMSVATYPRKLSFNLGEDCFLMLTSLAWIVWGGILLWG